MVKQNASVCNEEAGELAFSVLARTIASNSSRSDIDLVNKHFILSKLKLEVAKDLKFDIADSQTVQLNSHYKILPDSKQVAIVAAHFYVVVVNLKHNYFSHYPTHPPDAMFKFKNKVDADKKLVSSQTEEVKEWFMLDTIPKLTALIAKTKKAMTDEWLSKFKDHWPTKEAKGDAQSDDDNDSDGDGDDDDNENDQVNEEVKDVKVADPDWVDRDPSPPRPPPRKYGKSNARQVKRKRQTSGSEESGDECPRSDNKQADMKAASKEVPVRPHRIAKPRYPMEDEGSEADSNFMRQAQWNGNRNSEDDQSENE